MSPERLISLIAAKGIQMGYIPGGARPEWTAQEAAMACEGLPNHIYESLAFTYAGDHQKLWAIRRALFEWSWYESEAADWPMPVRDRAGDLAELWLLEVQQPWRFARKENSPIPDLRRAIIGVEQYTWRRYYSTAYEAIGMEFTIWLSVGLRRMRSRLRDLANA